MARTLPAWREPEALLGLADLAVAEREDAGREDVLRALAAAAGRGGVPGDGGRWRSPLRWCASAWREASRCEELVAPAVAEYIAEHGLYRAAMDAEAKARRTKDARRDEVKPEELVSEIARYAADKKAIDDRRARPARRARLHRLLPDLLGQHRAPDEGDPRRHPGGVQARARDPAAPGRGPEQAGLDPDGLPRRRRAHLHAARRARSTGWSSSGARSRHGWRSASRDRRRRARSDRLNPRSPPAETLRVRDLRRRRARVARARAATPG